MKQENVLSVTKVYSARMWVILALFSLLLVLFGSFFESPWSWLSDKTVGILGVIGSLLLFFLFIGNIVRMVMRPMYSLEIISSKILSLQNKKTPQKSFFIDMKNASIFIGRQRLQHLKEARMTGETYQILFRSKTKKFFFEWTLSEYELEHFFENKTEIPSDFLIGFFLRAGIPKEKIFYAHNKISDII